LQSDEHDEAEASGGRPSTDEGKREDPGQAGEIRVGEREEREGDDQKSGEVPTLHTEKAVHDERDACVTSSRRNRTDEHGVHGVAHTICSQFSSSLA